MAVVERASNVIDLVDNSAPSESDKKDSSHNRDRKMALGKRKVEPDFEEKVVWDADSDDGQGLKDLKAKSKRRRSGKRAAKEQKEAGGSTGKASDVPLHDYDVAGAPGYLRERRVAFDQGREILEEAGLLLPPAYDDVQFSDDEHAERLEEKPKFEPSTGVKPCRPYGDIELEHSAGVIPAPIAQYLRDYQVAGTKFLHRLFVYQRGGILGDDMGLGKTVQVAAFLTAAFGKTGDQRDSKRMRKMRRDARRWYPRILIVCPGSLIENWKNELDRWGWWSVDVYHGSHMVKDDVLGSARAGMLEVMVTTYTTYKNHNDAINIIQWDAVVADECHALKRGSAEITKAMDQVNALCRIGLTGTAIQNNYSELWTLLNWTNPGHFGDLSDWERTIAKPLRVGQSHDATLHQLKVSRETAKKLVTNLLPGFFLRRMKTLIAHQLPKKSDRVVFCSLTDEQRDAYKNFIARPEVELLRTLTDGCECGSGKGQGWCCSKNLADGRSWQSIIFPSVITLQKLVNHLTLLVPTGLEDPDKHDRELNTLKVCCPDTWRYLFQNRDAIVNLANPEFCGKWKVLKKLLKFWHDNGDKVLVFSHSVRLLRILHHLFHNTSYNVTYLDGSLSYPDRQAAVDNFNSDPSQFVFLISTKAGGVGLNITAANKVVIIDPHWNPSYDLQAQDRAYRIGQRRDVDVFRLVSSGTIEEIVYARQIYKQQQANIGYTASSERRYFSGVQEDIDRKGEIFGLENLFSFREDQLVIRDIVNKTNIAEAKAGSGIALAGVDMEQAANDEELSWVKQEPSDGTAGGGISGNSGTTSPEDGGMSQLAALVTAKGSAQKSKNPKQQQPKSDAIQAILSSAGVEYSHENSEVIGASKIEEQISRAVAGTGSNGAGTDASANDGIHEGVVLHDFLASGGGGFNYRYNPPEDVMGRQFCSMAREFGFESATQFALVVESWTQEQRRNCLDAFYRIRQGKLLAEENVKREEDEEGARGLDVDALLGGAGPGGSTGSSSTPKKEEPDHDAGNSINGNIKKEEHDVKSDVKEEVKSGPRLPSSQEPRRTSSIFIFDTDDETDDEL